MKKILAMTVLALAISSPAAFADDHGGKDGKRGGKMFEKHDTNGDGVISKDEFMNHASEKFSKMDADGNGEVTKDEGKAAWEARREKMKEHRAKMKEKKDAKTAE